MDDKKELLDEMISKKDIIEIFVKYYGEENRQFITKKITDVKIKYGMRDELAYKINARFKAKYQDKNENWESMAESYAEMLKNLSNEKVGVDATLLAKEANVLTDLGFNYKKIIRKTKEGSFEIIDSSETRKLKEIIKNEKFFISKRDKKLLKEADMNRFTELYNMCVDNNLLAFNKICIIWRNKGWEYDKSLTSEYQPEENKPFYKLNNLNRKNMEFLYDYFTAKGPADLWNDKQTKYILKGINKLFDKNYETMQEFMNDPQMKMFVDFKEKVVEDTVEERIASRRRSSLESLVDDEALSSNLHMYDPTDSTKAYYSFGNEGKINEMQLPIASNIAIDDILHEMNHCISASVDGDNINTGFAKSSEGFNEIMNEFLTQQAVNNIDAETVKKSTIKLHSNDCGYSAGVKFMSKFLNKFEPLLKKCQLADGNRTKVITDFIGVNNTVKLMLVGNWMKKCNYANLVILDDGNKKDIHDVLEDYKNNPNKPAYQSNRDLMVILSKIDDFMNEMVSNYTEFEKGNIVEAKTQISLDDEKEQSVSA